nr:hypothetical protein CFP56_38750 [Quercus suber]
MNLINPSSRLSGPGAVPDVPCVVLNHGRGPRAIRYGDRAPGFVGIVSTVAGSRITEPYLTNPAAREIHPGVIDVRHQSSRTQGRTYHHYLDFLCLILCRVVLVDVWALVAEVWW